MAVLMSERGTWAPTTVTGLAIVACLLLCGPKAASQADDRSALCAAQPPGQV